LQNKIHQAFPNALANKDVVQRVAETLKAHGYSQDTCLLATSLCCDELARPLEKDFATEFGTHFSMGGLAGFPFGGVTGFGAMASHVPDNGSCLVVYGPHIGVDSTGAVGTVERRGRQHGGACCGSAAAAAAYVLKVHKGECQVITTPDPLDIQQGFVGNLLLPYASRLVDAGDDVYVELPLALFDAQKKVMEAIVSKGASKVASNGKIAIVGGVQINTPCGMSDYFLPLQFDLFDNEGNKLETLLWEE
jgi:hypothetical protein